MSYIDQHARSILKLAPFIQDVSVSIDMSRVTPRVRTLAKRIVASRRFYSCLVAKSHILALAVFRAIAPSGTPYMTNDATLRNVTPSDEQVARYRDLIRTHIAMSRMHNTFAYTYPGSVEDIAERAVYEFTQSGYVRWVCEPLGHQRDEFIDELLAPDPEVTRCLVEHLTNDKKSFVAYTMERT